MHYPAMIFFCDLCGAANEPGTTSCVACLHPLPSGPDRSTLLHPTGWVTTPAMSDVGCAPVRASVETTIPGEFSPGMLLFGRYQLRQEIGRGGFSIVYLIEDLLAQRKQIALKRIPVRALSPSQMIDATEIYNRERQMLSYLTSVEGVPTCYGAFTDSENWYLLLEYIEGQTLEDYLRQRREGYLPELEVLEIGQQLARLLHRVHAKNIIVRDIKPANILRTPTGRLYLIDFGIARFLKPGQKKDTVPLGSPGYAAPEQYGRAQTDVRADIYGLGATLQTLLYGRDPFELVQAEPSRNPTPPSPSLQQLLNAMLVSERDQRPPTMKYVRDRLFRSSLSHARNRRRLLASFSAAVSLGLLLFIGLSLLARTLGVLSWFLFLIVLFFVAAGKASDRAPARRGSPRAFLQRIGRHVDTRLLFRCIVCSSILTIVTQTVFWIWSLTQ